MNCNKGDNMSIYEKLKVTKLIEPSWQHKDFSIICSGGAYYCIIRWSRPLAGDRLLAKVRRAIRLCGLTGSVVSCPTDNVVTASQSLIFKPFVKLSPCVHVEVELDDFDKSALSDDVIFHIKGIDS